jgi:molybdate transport system substrate-binding protein
MTKYVHLGAAAAVSAIFLAGGIASAAEITVLSVGSLRSSLIPLLSDFEKSSGHKVKMESGAAGAMVSRIQKGEVVDVVIVTPPQIETLVAEGKVVSGTQVKIAKVGMGLAASKSTGITDISTIDAFKRALLAAKSIGHTDPSGGASSAIYAAKLLASLDMAAELKPKIKTTFATNDDLFEALRKGDVELGFGQTTEIAATPGVTFVGPLPAPVQNYSVYSAGVAASANQPVAAKEFISFLTAPATIAAMKEKGVEAP